jgi:hypothetical protein
VTAAHLELQLPSGKALLRRLPLFLYFNYGQHFQYLNCEVREVEAILQDHDHQRSQELFLSLALRVSHRSLPSKYEGIQFISKSDRKGILALSSAILPTDNVYIAGKRILLTNEQMKWPDLILDKWESL